MTRIVQPLEGVQAQVLAFSPDSQKIAFVGSEGANETGLYVVNMASDYSQRILDLDSGDNLSWSPDGQYLILTGSENPGSNWKLLVVDAVTGEIAYRGSIEWGQEGQFILPEDSPAITRGLLIFSPVVSAVEACARPPE
jgi:dipeptidyl aminopeptidase/acylaminoacyl peptidase